MHTNQNTIIGAKAENTACEFLSAHGLQLIEKNFRVDQINGKEKMEIDLIMQDQDHLVFIEVKLRTHQDYGDAIEMISRAKQQRLMRAATYFLVTHGLYNTAQPRFDVVGITPDETRPSSQKINWIRDAFGVNY